MYKRAMDYFARHLKEDLPSIDYSSMNNAEESHPIVTTESVAVIKQELGRVHTKSLEDYWGFKCSVIGTPDSEEGTLLIASTSNHGRIAAIPNEWINSTVSYYFSIEYLIVVT